MSSQLTGSRLFNSFNNEKVHLSLCNNISESPVLLIICSQEILKKKQIGNLNFHTIQPAIENLKSLGPIFY